MRIKSGYVDRYEQRFLQGAFGQVTYELIFLNVQESSYGKYVCNLRNSKGDGTNEIILESKQFQSIVQ